MKSIRYLAGLTLISLAGVVSAQSSTCQTVQSDLNSCQNFGYCSPYSNYADMLASKQRNHPECFSSTTTTVNQNTATQTVTAVTLVQVNSISNAVQARTGSMQRGPSGLASSNFKSMAAGDKAQALNFWANLASSNNRLDYLTNANTNFSQKNDVLTSVFGVDYAINPKLLVGLSAVVDKGDGNTVDAGVTRNLDTSGYGLAPYVGWQISRDLALDASLGLGKSTVEYGATKTKGDRLHAALNLAYETWVGKLQVVGRAGFIHAEEKFGDQRTGNTVQAGTGSKNTINQVRVGGQVGYWTGGLMPYLGVTYVNDSRSFSGTGVVGAPIGHDAFMTTVGVNFFSVGSKVTGGLAYFKELGRSASNSDGLMANISLRY